VYHHSSSSFFQELEILALLVNLRMEGVSQAESPSIIAIRDHIFRLEFRGHIPLRPFSPKERPKE